MPTLAIFQLYRHFSYMYIVDISVLITTRCSENFNTWF